MKSRSASPSLRWAMIALAFFATMINYLDRQAMVGYTAALADMLAMPANVFPQESVASVYGLASMGSGFVGMIFALVTGWLVQHYSFVPAFFLFGLMPLVSVFIQWAFMGPLEKPVTPVEEAVSAWL